MSGNSLNAALTGAVMLLTAQAAPAHHSVAGQFDTSRILEWEGVITKVDWVNPHIYVYLDVTDKDGSVETWRLATATPAMMRKAGLTKAMLTGDGETVKIKGIPARDGTANLGWVYSVTYPDGHVYTLSADR